MNLKRICLNIIVFIFLSVMLLGAPAHTATITYTYDNLNLLTKVDYGNGTTTEYTYDAAGNRITLLTIDATPPSNPASTSSYSNSLKTTALASDNWYNYPAPYFEWSGASDSSGIAGYYVYFGTSSTADPVTAGTYQTASNYTAGTTLTSDVTYYLLIKAKDIPGNVATNIYTAVTYKYDSNPPETSITTQPSNLTNSTSASFSFTSTEAVSTFQCQIDNGGWSSCTSPKSYTGLTEGSHTFCVSATDPAGNPDLSPACYTWTIDTTAPDTSITSQPSNLANSPSATFEFVSTETGSTFQCQLDNGGYTACSSPMLYTSLADGSHTFYVKAVDSAGNTDSTPASYSWTVDTTAPTGSLNINNGADYANSPSVTLTISCTDASGCSEMQFSNDGIIWSSSETYVTNKPWTLSNGDGTKTIYIRFKDTAGNWSNAYSDTIVLDTVSPDTFITSQPANLTNSTSASFSFTSTKTGSSFECQMDSGGYSACTSPKSYTGLTEGSHTIAVRAKDATGNTDATPASYTWIIDITAPVLTLSTLADGAVTNNPILNIAGTVTDNTGVQGLEINSDAITVNADGSFSYAIQLTAGFNTVTTIATDLAGNKTTDTRVITLDVTAPTLAIISPADNSKTAVSVITVTGTIDESAAVEIRLNNGATQAASIIGNIFTANLSLVTGINTIEVTAIDLAGNKATQKRTVTYDNTSPSLEVTSPNQDIKTNQSSMVIRGTVSDTLTAVTITIKVDSDAFTPQVTDGQFEQAVTFNSEKTYQIIITAMDEAGNITTVQRNIIYDITRPSFDAVVTTPTNNSSQTISGSREENVTITVTSSIVTIGAVTYTTSTTWSVTISGLAEGSNTVAITARDAAGNESMVMKEILLDTIVPDTSITAQPPSLTNSTSASFYFTSTEDGSTFQCQLDGGGYTACTSPMSYSGLAEGNRTFEVRATDPAGNTDPTHASYTWTIDLTPPSVTISPVTYITNFISQAITGTVEAGTTVNVATDTIASDGPATVTGTMWNYTITGLVEGVNNIIVSATDAAGNTATATSSITLDTTAPDTSITARPSTPTNSTSANFSFTSTETGTTFQCQIDSEGYSSCSNPKSYTGLADGSHTFYVKATDPAGNADPTPDSYLWTINTINKEATAPDITVTPATLPFGNVNVDSNSESTVSVRNDGNANLAISTITNPYLPFSKVTDNCSGQTLAPSTGCTITVRFAPVSTGTFNSTFDTPSNDPDENPVTVSLTGTGANAGSPDITVLPSLDLSFPNILVGVTADQTVTIKNDGTIDLTISIITSPQAPFSIVTGENNCANHTLAPNQSCTIKVRFTPVASGTFKSSFNIPSNDPDENPVTVNLNGSVTPSTNNPPTKPTLAEPANGATGMPTTLTLKWDKSSDPEGDPITYKLYMGTDPSFANVNPMIAASISNKNNPAMPFRYSMGIFGLFGIIAIGGMSKNRRRIGFLIVTVIFVGGVLLTSCGSGSGTSGGASDNSDKSDKKAYVSYTVNLQPNTTYYWKVMADDGKGGTTESDTYSFTTGR